MEPLSNTARLTQRLLRQSTQQRAFQKGEGGALALLRAVFMRQRSFLAWSSLLSVVDLIEVWILLDRYHTFLVGGTLSLLRFLAIAKLLPLAALLGTRALLNRRQTGVREMIISIAQLIFILNVALSLGCIAWLAFGTTFTSTSSPLVRAIVLSGLVALPLEGVVTLSLFNLSELTTRPLARYLRAITYVLLCAALLMLWVGSASGYLICRIAAVSILPIGIIRLLGLQFISPSMSPRRLYLELSKVEVRTVLGFAMRTALLYFTWEMTFFLWSSWFAGDQVLALLFFVLHKTAHVAALLSFRFMLGNLGPLRRAIVAQVRAEVQRVVRLIEGGAVYFVAIGVLLMVPLALLKERLLIPDLPLGEAGTVLSPVMLATCVLFMVTFVVASIHLYLLSLTSLRTWHALLLASSFAFSSYQAAHIARNLAMYEHVEFSVLVFLYIGALLNILVCLVSRSLIGRGHGIWPVQQAMPETFLPVSAFLAAQESRTKAQTLLIITCAKRLSEELIAQQLELESPSQFTVVLGKMVIVRVVAKNQVKSLHQLITRIASCPELFTSVQKSSIDVRELLESILTDRFQVTDSEVSSLKASERFTQLCEAPGACVARWGIGGWELSNESTLESRVSALRFLQLFRRYSDPLHVAYIRGEVTKGVVVDPLTGDFVLVPSELRRTATEVQGRLLRAAIGTA